MATDPLITSVELRVVPAAAEEAVILANLLELYAHDFSEFHDLEIGEDGRFGYPSLPLYWSELNRHPFLIRMDGKLAGLVLVQGESGVSGSLGSKDAVWDMAEFFVMRGYRRRGIGTQAAHQVWRRFPGMWKVRVMQANVAARNFWSGAVSMYTGDVANPVDIEKAGERWSLFSFESNAEPRPHPHEIVKGGI
jgi:predicted acetyltransferase